MGEVLGWALESVMGGVTGGVMGGVEIHHPNPVSKPRVRTRSKCGRGQLRQTMAPTSESVAVVDLQSPSARKGGELPIQESRHLVLPVVAPD